MLNIDQLGFNLNFCAPFPAALVDLLDRNLIDWEKEKLHWPSGAWGWGLYKLLKPKLIINFFH